MTRYAYDTENHLTDIWDAASNHTQFSAYSGSIPVYTTFPSGLTQTTFSDSDGNITEIKDRNGNTTLYDYDPQNRLWYKQYQDASTAYYYYDPASRLSKVTDATGTYTFSYDNMNRLTSATTDYIFAGFGNQTVQYTYDAASNRKTLTDPQNLMPTAYGYDKLNRLSTITLNNDPSPDFTFGYDALSRRTSLARANGITTTYGYTSQSWVNSILHKNSAGTVLDGATYTYDNAGNRKTRADQRLGTTLTFGYDNIYQLLSVKQSNKTKESYTYDIVGNRLSSLGVSPYTYNSSNELMSLPSGSYGYDNNGNTKTKPDGTQYNWDFDNRLTQVVLPGSGGAVNFKYDPFGRRIQKAFTQGSTTTTTNYLYDGKNLLEELDSTGNVLARYTQEMRWDGPLSMLRAGVISYYEQDGLNSVSSLSNSSGTLAQTYTYDSYGKITAFTGNLTNPFQFTGQEFDAETGIEHYRARYYDSTIGRFVSEDPMGQLVGPNFYEYVLNRPTTLIDPSGEVPSPVRPYRWRYCTGSEVSACKKICEFEGKKYVSCRVSQRYRIGPRGWSIGPEWVDGPLSCNCSDKDECHKASTPDPNADTYMRNLMLGIGIGIGLGVAPEVVIPTLPKVVPQFAH